MAIKVVSPAIAYDTIYEVGEAEGRAYIAME